MANSQVKATVTPQRYSFTQLEQLWIKNGGNAFLAPVMAGIALAESSGIPTRTGHDQNGTVDRGLWQINSVHGWSNSYDPNTNAKQAIALVGTDPVKGLKNWSTYNNGNYLRHMPSKYWKDPRYIALEPKANYHGSGGPTFLGGPILGGGGVDVSGATSAGNVAKDAVKAAGNTVGGVEGVIQLGLKEGMYALAILGGAMLILLGLLFIGVDIGLSSLSKRASNHPVVQLANRVTPTRKEGGSGSNESSGDNNLPGPEE